MFDKIINFFKGNKSNPKIDFKVKDLGVGYILEYNLHTWVVEKEFIYTWGEGYFSKEWKISNGKDTLLLFFDDSEGFEISVSEEINILQELNPVRQQIIKDGLPESSFNYMGENWRLTKENPCLYEEKGTNNKIEMVVWIFSNSSKTEFISFSQFGGKTVNGYKGKYLKEYEIANILPAKSN